MSSEATESAFVVDSRPAPGVLQLTMSRPSRRNALSSSAMIELLAALKAAENDESIGCIVLAARGPVFSAGHDLRELGELRAGDGSDQRCCARVFDLCAQLMMAVVRNPKPVLAAVQGLATAAGCQLVASCDLAIAARSAAFATPGVDIGLFCATPSVALSRNVGRKAAMEMLLFGERVSAERARELGLVNRVVEDQDLDTEAVAWAAVVASKPRATVAHGKAAFYRQVEAGLEQAYSEMSRAMVEGLVSDDAGEGIGAFLDKRKPSWNPER